MTPEQRNCPCGARVIARGMCHAHYRRWRTKGAPSFDVPLGHKRTAGVRSGLRTRLINKATIGARQADGTRCLLFGGGLSSKGYGTIKGNDGETLSAHRAAYEVYVGPIPEGAEVDHLCFVRHCFNPVHLEAVSHLENVRRATRRKASA